MALAIFHVHTERSSHIDGGSEECRDLVCVFIDNAAGEACCQKFNSSKKRGYCEYYETEDVFIEDYDLFCKT